MNAEFNPILRGQRKPTRKNAIHAMCAHCVGCTETHLERGFKQEISACTSYGCPLYGYRPYSKSSSSEAIFKAPLGDGHA